MQLLQKMFLFLDNLWCSGFIGNVSTMDVQFNERQNTKQGNLNQVGSIYFVTTLYLCLILSLIPCLISTAFFSEEVY